MQIVHNAELKRVELYDDEDKMAGHIDYKMASSHTLHAIYTEVLPAYNGRGYGTKLVDGLADYARESGYTIVPVCPFVEKVFLRSPEKYKGVIGTMS